MPSTPDQLIEQATRHASHLERLKAGEVKRLRLLLSQIEAALLSMLARDDITAWTRARAEQQIAAIAAMQRARYGRDILPALDKAIIDLAEYEAGFEARSLQAVAPTVTFTLPASTQVLSAVRTNPLTMRGPDGGKLLSTFISEWTADQVERTSNAIRAGFAEGQTTVQVMRRLIDDVGPVSERGLSAMVRTSLQHVATQAREQTWQANRDIIRGVRWVSTLDSRTSEICRSLDNQVFPIDKGPRPPAHVNCRSATTAVLDDRFAFLEKDGTRFARDPETGRVGSVDADTSYYAWLKRQPADVQDSIIGPTRGRLLRDGGISAQRFAELQLGKNFMPLTTNARGETPIEQMRKMEPVAFSRAGI